MNAKGYSKGFSVVLGTALLPAACSFGVPAPPNPSLDKIVNTMEFFLEGTIETKAGTDLPDYWRATDAVFGEADAQAFRWTGSKANEAQLFVNASWWSPDSTDPNYDQNYRDRYADHARLWRDSLVSFGTFYIEGPSVSFNAACDGRRALGVTLMVVAFNDITTNPKLRASYIFYDVIEWAHRECLSRYNFDNVFMHVLVHELGHQRAGLTHPDESDPILDSYSRFHQGDYPKSPRVDVMWSTVSTGDLAYYYPAFDQYAPAGFPNCDNNTCANILHCLRDRK